MKNPIEVVTAYVDALGKGDIPTAFSFFDSNVKWHQPGNNQFSGVKTGVESIGEMLNAMMQVSKGTFSLVPKGSLMVNGNLVSMPLNFTGTVEDRTINMFGIDLFKIEGDKIVEIWLFSDNQEEEDVFWGK